jgi:hypothetical protein
VEEEREACRGTEVAVALLRLHGRVHLKGGVHLLGQAEDLLERTAVVQLRRIRAPSIKDLHACMSCIPNVHARIIPLHRAHKKRVY